MFKVRHVGLLLALSSVAVLPACSWFGGGNSGSESSSAAAPSPNYSSAAPQQQAEAQQPVTPDTIRQVQQTLQQQGMYHARVDGVWGPQTQAAVRSYQQKNNLNASGQLDQQTMASLTQGNDQGQSYNQQQPPPSQQNAQSNQQQPSQQNAQSNQQRGNVTR
jgi:peptidoglycan hydrolase-like protein with peptidoglycan-binding domain